MAKIGLFQLISYGMLAALVGTCIWILSQTLNPSIPKWGHEESINGKNPGLGFRPMPENDEKSTLIWLQGSNKTNYEKWKANLKSFLYVYYARGKAENIVRCSYDLPPPPGKVCDIDVENWGPCNLDYHFGYHRSAPCIFLKLDKINGWVPEYYNDPNDLPEDMPQHLKDRIRNTREEERNNIWISCTGENPADKENLGPIKYYPFQGLPGYYYPYMNSEGYLNPLVAVQFERPTSGLVINIECRAWAKNIKYSRHDRSGSVHFELLID